MAHFYRFNYSIQGLKNHVDAESVGKAIEVAKRQFLKTHYGMDHTHLGFYPRKAELGVSISLDLNPMQQERFKELYRAAKEDCLQGEEKQEFNQLYRITNDKRLSK